MDWLTPRLLRVTVMGLSCFPSIWQQIVLSKSVSVLVQCFRLAMCFSCQHLNIYICHAFSQVSTTRRHAALHCETSTLLWCPTEFSCLQWCLIPICSKLQNKIIDIYIYFNLTRHFGLSRGSFWIAPTL